jgi:hypothetical protein
MLVEKKNKYSAPKTNKMKNLEKDIMRKVMIYARPVLFLHKEIFEAIMCCARGWNECGNNVQILLVNLLEKRQFENKTELGG